MSIMDTLLKTPPTQLQKRKINVQVTFQEGGDWLPMTLEFRTVICIIQRDLMDLLVIGQFKGWESLQPLGHYMGIHAIKFPSGAIYDSVLARNLRREVRRQCWR